ncbi:DUF1993 family protein [Bradyrhizobium sp. AZCC 1693]|uniref:DUF1993 family protein n=1 Tax=Bradyrhizobium sp. AZCC 1693 TaxID=3117029 RepID=UPI002FF2A36E
MTNPEETVHAFRLLRNSTTKATDHELQKYDNFTRYGHRHAVVAGALLAGRAPHTFSDAEPDIPELKARISAAIDFVQGLPRAEIEAAADKEVAFIFKNGAQRTFTGKSLLLTFSVPQFFFHVTTAYDILRHAGVDLAKKDFLGPPR